ncbi:hypothetical protein AWZ03_011089 [Drosophila navojoa]|uniref:Uncharacterized protein n=1 Tax=Drosophila navojoa TaxID=7232 RepID=A0A484B3U3_DRONA|nr:hypothetical protein AWZ03_011089 [Drosophila navojoa]
MQFVRQLSVKSVDTADANANANANTNWECGYNAGNSANTTRTDGDSAETAQQPEGNSKAIALVIVGTVASVTLVIAAFYWLLRQYPKRGNTMNFSNPTYNKTTEDTFSLEKNASINRCGSAMEEELYVCLLTEMPSQ